LPGRAPVARNALLRGPHRCGIRPTLRQAREEAHHAGRCVRAFTGDEDRLVDRHLAGPGESVDVNRAQQRGGSEATLWRQALAGPSHLLQRTARQRCAAVQLRVACPRDVLVFVPCSGRVAPRRVSPTRCARNQDFSRQTSPPRCRVLGAIQVSSGWHHRGCLRRICSAPCGGRRRPTLSGGQAGSEAQLRPRQPRPASAALPMQPAATAPRGQLLASAPTCPPRLKRRARVEPPHASNGSANRPSGWSNIRPDNPRLAASALRCAGLFDRTPSRSPCGTSPASG